MKEMKPNEEKLVEKMAETRLGVKVGKGVRGQHRHMMEGWGRGCMAAWESDCVGSTDT